MFGHCFPNLLLSLATSNWVISSSGGGCKQSRQPGCSVYAFAKKRRFVGCHPGNQEQELDQYRSA